MLKGIDISKWQQGLNLATLKNSNQLDFVIMKATEGVGYVDSSFEGFRNAARSLNLLVGFYHFARPDLGNSAVAEANYFCDVVRDLKEDEWLILDYEPHWNVPSETQVQWCLDFLRTIEIRLEYKPLIYLNGNQNRTMDWSPVVANNNGLWLATYPYNTPDFNNPPATDWPFIAMWQYTSSGQLRGYNGNLDLNIFYGDAEQFKKYGYKGGSIPTPNPQPEPQPQPHPTPETYTVKRGDTLSGIASKFNTTWQKLYELNKKVIGSNPNHIIPGQVLRLR